MSKSILTISGSNREESTTIKFLLALDSLGEDVEYFHYVGLDKIALYRPIIDQSPLPEEVVQFRDAINRCDAVIICTPEYLHNIPAQLKSALEWTATSGNLKAKPVLAMTYTPHPPRGDHAMQSLLWSLTALDARVVASMSLYYNRIKEYEGHLIGEKEEIEIVQAAISLLIQ